MNDLEDLPSNLLFKINLGRIREYHIRLVKNHVLLNTREYFFSQKVIYFWNFLQSLIVNSESVNKFKNPFGPLFEKQRSHCKIQRGLPVLLVTASYGAWLSRWVRQDSGKIQH